MSDSLKIQIVVSIVLSVLVTERVVSYLCSDEPSYFKTRFVESTVFFLVWIFFFFIATLVVALLEHVGIKVGEY